MTDKHLKYSAPLPVKSQGFDEYRALTFVVGTCFGMMVTGLIFTAFLMEAHGR
jgi:hypothetical protein